MHKKIVWLIISCLMVVALVLASCGPAEEEEEEAKTVVGEVEVEEEEEEEVAEEVAEKEMVENILGKLVEKPQYGGTIRYRSSPGNVEHFDPIYWHANATNSVINDRFMTAPWEIGPSGSNEHPLDYSYYPQRYYRGDLLESFEVIDLYTVRYTLKKGIHFWNKPPVNGREVTVDDVIYGWIRQVTHPRCETYLRVSGDAALTSWTARLNEVEEGTLPEQHLETYLAGLKNEWKPVVEDLWPGLTEQLKETWAGAYEFVEGKGYDVADIPLFYNYLRKIDKYTFEYVDLGGNVSMWSWIASHWVIPHEVVDEYGDFNDWDKVVCTGAWIPEDYVPDSSVTYVRNPNYWQSDPLLPENRLPYADKLIALVIVEDSTFYAALRTGKIDLGGVAWRKVESFIEGYPEMLHSKSMPTWTHTVSVRTDIEPFSDVRVRQACMLAVDQQKMADEFYEGMSYVYTWPAQPAFTEDIWIPPDKLPESVRELYGYDPDKAKALLAEAGYPNGFKTTLWVYNSVDDRESCLIFADYLADIGIDLQVEVPEPTMYMSILYGRQYDGMISCWWGNNFPGDVLNWAEGGQVASPYNFSNVKDVKAEEVSRLLQITLDDAERNAILKEENLRHMELVYNIVLPTPEGELFWWPWLKAFHGERDLGWPDESAWGEIPKYLWVDQDLKFEMVGERE